MNTIETHLCEKITELRKEANLTQEEVATVLQLTRASVQNMEIGRQRVSLRSLYLYACIFNIPIGDFFPAVQPIDIVKRKRQTLYEKRVVEPVFEVNNIPKI